MEKFIQEAINDLNKNDSLGDQLIKYLKDKFGIDFYTLDSTSQALYLQGFEIGYRVGNNFKINIQIRGPRADSPFDIQTSTETLMFEDL